MNSKRRAGLATAMVVAMLCGAVRAAPAQRVDYRDWNQTGDPLVGGIGLHYGKLGGHGLSFRLPVEWWLYVQLSGGIWHSNDHKQHNLGGEVHYLLRQDRRLRLFLAAGAAYFYDREKTLGATGVDVFTTRRDWNTGLGVGLEILQGERWSWLVEADFVHDGRRDDIKVVPQVGVYYYW